MDAPIQCALLASAARTALVTGADQVNLGYRGLHLTVDVTSVTATPVLTVTIQGKDALGVYYDILVGTAITATGTTVLKVYPGIAVLAGGSASDFLPAVWRYKVAVADTDSATYSVAVCLAP